MPRDDHIVARAAINIRTDAHERIIAGATVERVASCDIADDQIIPRPAVNLHPKLSGQEKVTIQKVICNDGIIALAATNLCKPRKKSFVADLLLRSLDIERKDLVIPRRALQDELPVLIALDTQLVIRLGIVRCGTAVIGNSQRQKCAKSQK